MYCPSLFLTFPEFLSIKEKGQALQLCLKAIHSMAQNTFFIFFLSTSRLCITS